jgi:hypothetical protein
MAGWPPAKSHDIDDMTVQRHAEEKSMPPEILSWLRLLAFAGGMVALVGGLVALSEPMTQLVVLR